MPDGSFDELGQHDAQHMQRTGKAATPRAKPNPPPVKKTNILILTQDDVWFATEGAAMFDRRTGKSGIVVGWSNPARWDDDGDGRLVACSARHPDAGFRTVTMKWKDGTTEHITEPENLCEEYSLGDDPENFDRRDYMPKPALHFLDYDEMMNLPDPKWLVEGLIMEQTSALMFGKSNSFKSFLGIDLACALATGRAWHGREVAQPVPVLYVATEGAIGVAKQRIPGWMEANEIPEDLRRKNIRVYPREISIDSDGAIDTLLQAVGIYGAKMSGAEEWGSPAGAFALVVLDIFGATMDGPETSDETARAWVRNVNRIMREVGCAVLTIAHTGWADETRARMHTHFWGSFDTRLKAVGDKDSRTTVLSVDRHKDADSTGEWGFRLDLVDTPTGGTTLVPRLCDDVEVTQKRRVSGKPAVALQALSEALIDQGKTVAGPNYPACPVVAVETWRAMCDRHGLSDSENTEATRKAFQRAKTTLIEKGLVRQFDSFVWKTNPNE